MFYSQYVRGYGVQIRTMKKQAAKLSTCRGLTGRSAVTQTPKKRW